MRQSRSKRIRTRATSSGPPAAMVLGCALLAVSLAGAAAAAVARGKASDVNSRNRSRAAREAVVVIESPEQRATVETDDDGNVTVVVRFGASADLSSFEASIKK